MIQITKIPIEAECECDEEYEEYEEGIESIPPEVVRGKVPLYTGEGFGM